MNKIFKNIAFAGIAVSLVATGCKKEYLETAPTESVGAEEVFQSTDGAMVALDGAIRTMYSSLTNHGNFGQKSYDLVADLMGEDMVVHSQGYNWLNSEYNYSVFSNAQPDQRPDRTWFYYYRIINNVNRILVRLPEITGTDEAKSYLEGQCLALRAHSYYYLVNFFGQYGDSNSGVPMYLAPTSDGAPRSSVGDIYKQVYLDLERAETLLGTTRQHASHLNQSVVQGIYARVALQHGDFDKALSYATKAIANSGKSLYTRTQYTAAAFNTISAAEWMWGAEVNVEQATIFASFYSHIDNRPAVGGYAALGGQKKITKALYDKIAADDIRKSLFQATPSTPMPIYAQLKFQLRTAGNWASDYLFMRLAEMYLIKAEAAARLGQNAVAIQTLEELVKTRYSAYTATGLAGNALLDEILVQRKIELWGEGFGILDVKRLGKGLNRPTGPGNHGGDNLNGNGANNFAHQVTTLPARSNRWLFAIPQDEINANASLTMADQNPATD
ncbi:hypothetical protein BV902_25365 [Sphingobacterium sp. B29]|uniref:RagB/SusD family nutrient uptake outer membrane protein n=1 Tax=Sphingobacterium sp. B29 TaxID=1933220 RepID=UPI0009584219|nr:RagB/SusD family nutrient uptake outer membrane protein [Sphingobacterium sp. B29]APU99239.1 hypothetical protein BV902_25365 [Sphingobacterium sp. B29]